MIKRGVIGSIDQPTLVKLDIALALHLNLYALAKPME
jgi:hypothetical protein